MVQDLTAENPVARKTVRSTMVIMTHNIIVQPWYSSRGGAAILFKKKMVLKLGLRVGKKKCTAIQTWSGASDFHFLGSLIMQP